MHRIITGATGLVGKALVAHWLAQNHQIIAVGRSKKKIISVLGSHVQALEWEELTPEIVSEAEVVVNLAGDGLADKRWTDKRKQEILTSRTGTTDRLVSMLTPLGKNSPPLFNASAIGVYGLQPHAAGELSQRLDEESKINFKESPDFLAEVARAWELATLPAKNSGVRVVNMRFGVVLSKDGGALPMLARPFYFYVGGPIGNGDQAVSWVALEDLVRAIDFIFADKNISGPVNIVAPDCVMQSEFAKTLAETLQRPHAMRMPAFVMKILLGQMADELLLEGQNIYPRRLIDAGFVFNLPDLHIALKQIYS
jgi:uncharacterized protein (TIGR01777 family)